MERTTRDRRSIRQGKQPGIHRSPAGEAAIHEWYEAQLTSAPVRAESILVDTPAGPTHVLAAGPEGAAAVVVLHGMNMNAAAMLATIGELADQRRVYAVDIIGMPGRSAGTRLPRAGRGYPDWLESVLDGLGLETASFLGVSFGGWLVLKLAATAPERLNAAVLLDTGGLVPFTIRGQVLAGVAALRYMIRPTHENAIRAAAPFYSPGTDPDPHFAELLALGYRHTRLDVDPRGLPVLSRAELSRFSAPTWVSYGEHDIFFDPRRALARAREVLPGLKASELVAGEGHVRSPSAEKRIQTRVSDFLFAHAP